ncbi:MAG TPA: hypothetical protein VHE55_00710 [Fimbriimonadaceae bacterium]|nr:hypothetical protein [Fimbriimonadaceae bacterium]
MKQRYVFDQFPLSVRLATFGIFLVAAGYVGSAFPTPRGLFAIPMAIGVLLLLVRQSFVIDCGRKLWWYRRGLWPAPMVSTCGTFDQLYGISIGVSHFERKDRYSDGAAIYVSNYTATLFFQDDVLSPQPVYSGGSFTEVAEPAAHMAHALSLPMMLDHDLQWRSEDLAKFQAEAASLGN